MSAIQTPQRQDLFMKSNPLDQQAAKAAAKRLFQKVNFSGGPLQSYEISSLLTDTYEYLKIPFNPTSRDVKAYSEVLDANRDGQVTLADLETLAVQYLCGSGVLSNQAFDPVGKKQKYQLSGISTSSYSNSYSNSIVTSPLQPTFSSITQQNSAVSYEQKPLANGYSQPTSTNQPQYSQQTLQHLSLTKTIFQRNADKNQGITFDRVAQLLSETYETLGRKGYRPSEEDVRVWMKLCDGNGDGRVEYEEYEYFVIRSLERSGYQIYK